MCGIVGAVAQRNVVPILLEGLRRLEYRGYDSAGLVIIDGGLKRVAQHRPRRRRWPRNARRSRCTATSASPTRAGPPTARRRRPMRTRMSAAAWRWCTTASSKTTKRCAPG